MFTIKLTRLLFFVSTSFLLLSCSASYITQPPIFDIQKVEYQTGYFSEDESIGCSETYLEFVRQEGDLFLFYTEIENNSEDTLAVYPQEIYLEVVKDLNDLNNSTNRYFALDPAKEIETINNQLKDEGERNDDATVLNVFSGIFSTVVVLASDIGNKGEAIANTILNTGANQIDEEVYHSEVEKRLNENKEFWMKEMLNESIIYPGDTAKGLVYLPYSSTAETFKVVIPVCGFPDAVVFRQIQTNR